MKTKFFSALAVVAATGAFAAPAGAQTIEVAEVESGTCTLVMPCVNAVIDLVQKTISQPPPLITLIGEVEKVVQGACYQVYDRPCTL
jgi:hypothetical protein